MTLKTGLMADENSALHQKNTFINIIIGFYICIFQEFICKTDNSCLFVIFFICYCHNPVACSTKPVSVCTQVSLFSLSKL